MYVNVLNWASIHLSIKKFLHTHALVYTAVILGHKQDMSVTEYTSFKISSSNADNGNKIKKYIVCGSGLRISEGRHKC